MQCVGVHVHGSALARCAQRVDAASAYAGPFCQQHYSVSRPLYERYKQSCDEAFRAVERAQDTPESTRRFLRAYALLTRAVEQRRKFMHLFVHPVCHDDGHVFQCRRLLQARQDCEQRLRLLFAAESAADVAPPASLPAAAAASAVASPAPGIAATTAAAAGAASERAQEAALRKFLDDAVREAEAETARRDRVMDRLARVFTELGDLSMQHVRTIEQSHIRSREVFLSAVSHVVFNRLLERMLAACLSAQTPAAAASACRGAPPLSAHFADVIADVRDVCMLRPGMCWYQGVSMHRTLLDFAKDVLDASPLTVTDLNFIEGVLQARAFRREQKENGRAIRVVTTPVIKPDGSKETSIFVSDPHAEKQKA